MSLFTSAAGASGFLPEDFGQLIEKPVAAASVAFRTGTVVRTTAHAVQFPILTADPAAAWTAEGAEIGLDDPELDTVTVTPSKLAGLTAISNEMVKDSDPASVEVVGRALARDIARKLDSAFLGNTVTNGPSGLGSLAGVNVIDNGSGAALSVTNLDPFIDAIANGEINGMPVTTFVAHPDDVAAIMKIKAATDSNVPLLGSDPSQPGAREVAGVPLLASAQATAGTIWAIPRDAVMVVQRQGTSVEIDESVYFSSDRTAVRAIMRVGFGFVHEAAISKLRVNFA